MSRRESFPNGKTLAHEGYRAVFQLIFAAGAMVWQVVFATLPAQVGFVREGPKNKIRGTWR